MRLAECVHLDDLGRCVLGSALAKRDVKPWAGVCETCQSCSHPMQNNYVIVSIARHVCKNAGDTARYGDILLEAIRDGYVKYGLPRYDGPGDFLEESLLRWHIRPNEATCSCASTKAEMNRKGPSGCRQNLNRFADLLMGEAKDRKFLRYLVRIAPGSARNGAKNLILEACSRYERFIENYRKSRELSTSSQNDEKADTPK